MHVLAAIQQSMIFIASFSSSKYVLIPSAGDNYLDRNAQFQGYLYKKLICTYRQRRISQYILVAISCLLLIGDKQFAELLRHILNGSFITDLLMTATPNTKC